MKKQFILGVLILLVGLLNGLSVEPIREGPKFEEVYQLLRTNGGRLSETELNRAALKGLLGELSSQVMLVPDGTNRPAISNLLSRVTILENAYGYFRMGKIESGLTDLFKSAYQKLLSTNKLKGIVLDLRYSRGTDYATAARTADLFMKTDQPLLRWGEASAQGSTKTNAITVPVAILVNRQTSGAAEALAAILREAQVGLLIGTNTAGQASVFKEFPLSNGQVLKIASAPVQLGNGKEISSEGLRPDIEISLSQEDEKAFYDNAYRELPRLSSTIGVDTNNLAGSGDTNRPRRRINEAELVRLQREGISPESEFPVLKTPGLNRAGFDSEGPALSDPVLIRALDLLKGLAVIQRGRRF